MSIESKKEMLDKLAGLTAELDQAQGLIDEARTICVNPVDHIQLDAQQVWLNCERKQVEILRTFLQETGQI